MALQDISLPVDVPWSLLATSTDMLASHANRFPNAMWRSSLAVFKYDPTADDLPDADEYTNRALTFIKVVVSVTSYTPDCSACPPAPQSATAYESANVSAYQLWQQANAQCQAIVHQAYPCFGALVQVAVYPTGQDTTDVNQLAYFAAFEPKKRELIEAATESGEAVTQSKSDMNVRKGVTSTQSTEDLDVFTGANLSVGAAGASAGAGISGQWGTIKKSGTQQEDVTNTDSSRDTRETASHTTSLSQLYHLLNSYHLGTNRAIFFVQPRPHTLQQKDQFTFINGPQEIEGVQEFFLVVNRPIGKQITDYCVDALLYTGHLDIVAMQNVISEPKTAETPWIDLWVAAPPLPHKDTHWYDPSQIFGKIENLTQDMLNTLENAVGIQTPGGQLSDEITLIQPAVLDVYVPPQILNQPNDTNSALLYSSLPLPTAAENGWQIDRTRGLGGYDLWEDPNNLTADFRGNFDDGKTAKSQAFIDIVPSGTPDDFENYIADYALRVRATAYPRASDDGQATYHCRVKAYFIRNDLPTNQRTVNMFVTARGISTCADSPFNDLEPTGAVLVGTGSTPDIIADAQVNPPSIAPWTAPVTQQPAAVVQTNTADSSGNSNTPLPTPAPMRASAPSGLNHSAVGAARAKMANSVSGLVRTQLVASLRCLPNRAKVSRFRFPYTDLYFQKMLRIQLKSELLQLAAQKAAPLGLSKAVLLNPASNAVLGIRSSTTTILRNKFSPDDNGVGIARAARKAPAETEALRTAAVGKLPAFTKTRATIAASKQFPLLTLHSSRIPAATRQLFVQRGISSALDLVGITANELSMRTGMNMDSVRALRFKLLGLSQSDAGD